MTTDLTIDAADDDDFFSADDLTADTEITTDTLSADDMARLERERAESASRDVERAAEVQADDDEAGRQRRENVRVMAQVPITVTVEGFPAIDVRTRDLSATGIGFATRLPLDLEAEGRVAIRFDGWISRHDFTVRFVRPILAGRQVGVQLHFSDKDERERLVKEVFEIQRQQLQSARTGR